MPLHRPKTLAAYHQQLAYCVMQYIEKDPQTAVIVVNGLIRYWPWTVSAKQVQPCSTHTHTHSLDAALASSKTDLSPSLCAVVCTQVVFLNELEEVLELMGPELVDTILEPLFKCVSKCVGSPHFQVAERALFLWNNDHLLNVCLPFAVCLCASLS